MAGPEYGWRAQSTGEVQEEDTPTPHCDASLTGRQLGSEASEITTCVALIPFIYSAIPHGM